MSKNEWCITATPERNCTLCAFATRQQHDHKGMPREFMYSCRYNPPSSILIPTGPGSAHLTSTFPIVTAEIVCVQFEEKGDF